MNLDVVLSNKTVSLSSSEYPCYGLLKHQHDLDGKSILEHNGWPVYPASPTGPIGVPSVFRGIAPSAKQDYCYFTRPWQMFSFELLKMNVRMKRPSLSESDVNSLAKRIFASGYKGDRFQSNKEGTDTNHDYVNGNNVTKEDIRLQYVFTGGNVVQILGKAERITGGYTAYPVRCFDGNKPPPDPSKVNWITHPELILRATIETRIVSGVGNREVRPFDLVGVSEFPYFIIVKGYDVIWIPIDRIKKITMAEAIANNPYV